MPRGIKERKSFYGKKDLCLKFEWSKFYQLYNLLVYFNSDYKNTNYLRERMQEFSVEKIEQGPMYQTSQNINRISNRNWYPFVRLVLHEVMMNTGVPPELERIKEEIRKENVADPAKIPWVRS